MVRGNEKHRGLLDRRRSRDSKCPRPKRILVHRSLLLHTAAVKDHMKTSTQVYRELGAAQFSEPLARTLLEIRAGSDRAVFVGRTISAVCHRNEQRQQLPRRAARPVRLRPARFSTIVGGRRGGVSYPQFGSYCPGQEDVGIRDLRFIASGAAGELSGRRLGIPLDY